MRKSRCTESQIVKALKEVKGGRSVTDVCRENGVSDANYYNWKAQISLCRLAGRTSSPAVTRVMDKLVGLLV